MGSKHHVVALVLGLLTGACGERAPEEVSAALSDMAVKAETEVRAEFRNAMGREVQNGRELLQYIDRVTLDLPALDDRSLDNLVQAYGATLGQVLQKELGGKWVRHTVDGEPQDGIELPNGQIAFVFNRAYRRIADKDPIGFEAYFDSADRLLNGQPLPEGIENKKNGDGV